MSVEEYEALYNKQGGACAGCLDPMEMYGKNTHVDHRHDTSVVRGILCNKCNITLGCAMESIVRLTGLVKYLENNHGKP